MTQAVRAVPLKERLSTTRSLPRVAFGDLKEWVLPIVVAVLCLVSLTLTWQRADMLRTWPDDYAGRGSFLVTACAPQEAFGADQWRCAGSLTGSAAAGSGTTTLITSLGAVASERPYVGQRVDVFFHPDDESSVYPVAYRLNELTRLYLSLLPRLLVLIGSVIWLAGWFLTRNVSAEDRLTRDSIRLPQRFSWRARGLTWIGVAVLVAVINFVVATRVIGSLGVI